jgi:hypothetical protein
MGVAPDGSAGYEEVPGGLDDNLERFKQSGALDEWKLQIATVLKDLRDVESNAAQVLTGCVVIANAIVLGLEADYHDWNFVWHFLDHFFAIYFAIEVWARLRKRGVTYFFCRAGVDLKWNYFDLMLALTGLADLYLIPVLVLMNAYPEHADKRHPLHAVLRLIRLLRLMRMLRIVRLFRLKWVREILYYVENFTRASATLFGGVAIFAAIGYVFAILLTYMATGYPTQESDRYFGSVLTTCRSLFIVVTLDGWADIAHQAQLATGYDSIFIFFVLWIMTSVFLLASLLSGVVSEQMAQFSSDRHESMMAKREERFQVLINQLRALIKTVTHGRMDGKITEHELEDMVELIGATIGDQLFREFHVDAEVLRCLFDVCDYSNRRRIDSEDMLDSLLRLTRNEPNSRELIILQYNVQRINYLLTHLLPNELQPKFQEKASRKLVELRLYVDHGLPGDDFKPEDEEDTPA